MVKGSGARAEECLNQRSYDYLVFRFSFSIGHHQTFSVRREAAASGIAFYQWITPGMVHRIHCIPCRLVTHFHRLGGLGDRTGFGDALQQFDAPSTKKISALQREPEAAMGLEFAPGLEFF